MLASLIGRSASVVSVLALAGLIASCASKGNLVTQAVKANMAVEESSNQILLLNIVRAYQRRPMYFSTFTRIDGPSGYGATGPSAFIPFDSAANALSGLTLGHTFDRPLYGISPLDSEEFMRGFMRPIDVATLNYYVAQGWPKSLLLHLAVKKIELYDPENKVVLSSVTNYPQGREAFPQFQKIADRLATCELSAARDEGPKIGPPIFASQLQDGEKLAALLKDGYALHPIGKDEAAFQLRGAPEPRIQIGASVSGALTDCQCAIDLLVNLKVKTKAEKIKDETPPWWHRDNPCPTSSGDSRAQVQRMTAGGRPSIPAEKESKTAASAGESQQYELVLHLRSPEAMVYYLGEVARAQLIDTYCGKVNGSECPSVGRAPRLEKPIQIATYVPGQHSSGDTKNLFILRQTPDPNTPASIELANAPACEQLGRQKSGEVPWLKVDYDGVSYWVPDEEAECGRSFHALSLISQLIGLQKKAKDLPASSTVQVIR